MSLVKHEHDLFFDRLVLIDLFNSNLIGHSIGLGHSDHHDAVMYMYYTKTTGLLSADDISGIHHIYGVPRKHTLLATTQNPSPETDYDEATLQIPEKCDTSYDAIAMIRNELFIFKGRYMWRPSSNSDAIEIRKMWTELPESLAHVDAVYENEDSKIWFFVGHEIYVFSGTTFEHRMTLAHIGIDHHFKQIDAIFKWHFNKLTYVFSGDQYWKFNGDRVDEHYPKNILRAWRDVYDIDTAFSQDEKLYFFKGKSFYEFNHRSMRLNRMTPQPIAQNFMNCPGQKQLFKLATRFWADDNVDVIDDEEIEEPEDDEENPEKPLLQQENVVTPENTSDDASKNQLLLFIMLASLAISRVLSSISLYL
jgi:Hemopexin/Matrixin